MRDRIRLLILICAGSAKQFLAVSFLYLIIYTTKPKFLGKGNMLSQFQDRLN